MKVWWCHTPAYALSGAPYHLNYTCREDKYSKLSPFSAPLLRAVLNHNLPGALLHWACLSLRVRLQTAPPPRQPPPTRAGSWHKIYFAPEYTVNQKNGLTTGGSGQQWTQKEAVGEESYWQSHKGSEARPQLLHSSPDGQALLCRWSLKTLHWWYRQPDCVMISPFFWSPAYINTFWMIFGHIFYLPMNSEYHNCAGILFKFWVTIYQSSVLYITFYEVS